MFEYVFVGLFSFVFHFSFMFDVEKNKRITDVKKKRDPQMKVETMNMIQHFE